MMNKHKGFVLVASLLTLILLTVLGACLAKTFTLQETISGNQREKTRAVEMAQSALSYAEWWLNQGNNGVGAACQAANAATTVAFICTNSLANPQTVPWGAGVNYTPANIAISTTGGVNTIYAIPKFYIQYLGSSPNTGNNMYKITAMGYGGNSSTIAVIESIFEF